ncbi:PREDICTED: uncharacterized protein LOC104590217 [Nelumbo nucifera]|uniref:Uncharacterized protein LOC104590217 n=1 Tax=Nelumbo nucifera TaxID=4432 RepID=A0A1U8Q1Z1_NELNU|nr:PREDICTED: uncharacterized protein LOC104590217 [Nelumbo nucifera]XP_019052020.1 PREDICTED: uncharacterized protein LOC104590217 [Nelumbo nucifera]XP_019052021.1 PREDICTED: uncharacterized protein LOC104590217 [Nelumbo nucifera]XP_019052022.1 PREDICTED: uncharacterized protein LOC104590217 [Nelumbo nucifera]XP_019052023.1 PREDICTED: uncharacterized protein LOC104590217 [Nelumbo nucifera]XP_019052024.1 PREDICTED: uncharacterized protein LOC104590217 [Nelumbo nucifera]XP_019052025.1 PREDICTE
MGGILHLFEFNQASMSRKSLGHSRHVDGLEAPRNSLELPIETSQNFCSTSGNIPYSYQVKHTSSRKNCYPSEASVKNLIDEEVYRGPATRRNVPSVVARLMGMDMLPSETQPAIHAKEKKNEYMGNNFRNGEQYENGSAGRSAFGSKPLRKTEMDFLTFSRQEDTDLSSSDMKYGKRRPREHPQEEELQKFKKEFEAWQAARIWEHRKVVELGRIPGQWLAQENFNKETIALHAESRSLREKKNPRESNSHTSVATLKGRSQERGALQHQGFKKESSSANQIDSVVLRNRTNSSDAEQISLTNCNQKPGKSSMPTRIVILKPGPDGNCDSEDSWAGSSETAEEEGGIEALLEEVKERLRCEIQGKSAKGDISVRRVGIGAPFSGKQSDPKEIAQNIAKQVRESVTKDLGMNLLRSESARSYRSETQINGQGPLEFINRDMGKCFSERLRNVVKREKRVDAPTSISGSSRASALCNNESRIRPIEDALMTKNIENRWEDLADEPEIQTRSFRHGHKSDEMLYTGELSPRNLIRSLSAPVSGNSFGKLLLEDRHILTGAQIRRKHESTENVSVELRKKRKERFSFRGKVSNLRYSFTLRGKLFRRKIQVVKESGSNGSGPVKDIMSGPTVVMNPGNAHDNSTEVPPSPASVCSSGHEELCQPVDHLSPISTLDMPLLEDCPMPRVFREISSNLQELRRQLNQLDSDGPDDTLTREEPREVETLEIQDEKQAYIRDLLIASGLYDGPFDCSFSKWDSLEKPISYLIFEEVEESYKKRAKENEEETRDQKESKEARKLLFDLLNEALATILGSLMTTSRFKRRVLGPSIILPSCGKKLLGAAWEMIHKHVNPPMDGSHYSLDGMVACDLGKTPWSGMMLDDVDVIGREIEWMILGELMEETVRDMWLY